MWPDDTLCALDRVLSSIENHFSRESRAQKREKIFHRRRDFSFLAKARHRLPITSKLMKSRWNNRFVFFQEIISSVQVGTRSSPLYASLFREEELLLLPSSSSSFSQRTRWRQMIIVEHLSHFSLWSYYLSSGMCVLLLLSLYRSSLRETEVRRTSLHVTNLIHRVDHRDSHALDASPTHDQWQRSSVSTGRESGHAHEAIIRRISIFLTCLD